MRFKFSTSRRTNVVQESETTEDYKKRWRSLRILYATVFFDSFSFSMVLSSIWPYIKKINSDPDINPVYVGWATVGFELAGATMAFVMGLWSNKRGSTEPLLSGLFCFCLGNLLYGYAQACGDYGITMIIIARTVIGLSTGTTVVARIVAAEATTLKERTVVTAHQSLGQALGFSCGPVIQLASVPLGDNGVYFSPLNLHLNMYTVPTFASLLLGILNMIMISVWYEEYRVDIYKDDKEDEKVMEYKNYIQLYGTEKKDLNKLAIGILIMLHFIIQGLFALNQTILTPLAMDQYAWTREEATLWVGIIFLVAGVIAIAMFAIIDLLQKRIKECVLLILGLFLCLVGMTIYQPMGNKYPLLKTGERTRNVSSSLLFVNASDIRDVGCPAEEYTWCETTPQIHLAQVLLGMFVLSISYPIALVLTISIYSKVIRPKKQGILQSCFIAIGGIGQAAAPAITTYLYVIIGPRWTFFIVDGLLIIAIVLAISGYKRFIPYHLYILKKHNLKVQKFTNIAYNVT